MKVPVAKDTCLPCSDKPRPFKRFCVWKRSPHGDRTFDDQLLGVFPTLKAAHTYVQKQMTIDLPWTRSIGSSRWATGYLVTGLDE